MSLPVDLEAEKAVLGCILIQGNLLNVVSDILEPSDFFNDTNGRLYLTMLQLHSEGTKLDPQLVYSRATAEGVPVDQETLMGIMQTPPATSNVRRYAEIVVGHSRRRRLFHRFNALANEAMNPGCDPDALIAEGGDIAFDRLAAARVTDSSDLWKLIDFMEVGEEMVENTPWVIPGILRRRWRSMLIAEEGAGKFTFFMQIAMLIACGFDPFDLTKEIEPQRVLIVNGENPQEVITHQGRLVERRTRKPLAKLADENIHIWHKEAGVDLLSRTDQAAFERVIQDVRPNLILMGPVYKLFEYGERSLELDTKNMLAFLDDIRVRHDAALMIEHHMPKGESLMNRQIMPGGSSLWLRWPEMGLVMRAADKNAVGEITRANLERFRGDRLPCDWPTSIERGVEGVNNVPWVPTWKEGRKPLPVAPRHLQSV